MEQIPKEMLKAYVDSQRFNNATEIMDAMKEMFREVLQQVMESELDTELGYEKSQRTLERHLKMLFSSEYRMSFFAGKHTGVYSLNYRSACRLEARQVLIYQCILDLTGEKDKYNYSKAVHFCPPLSYSPCSAKNYKIAPSLTPPKNERQTKQNH